jgi:dihydroorotase
MAARVDQLVIERVRAIDPSRELDARMDVTIASGRVAKISPSAGARTEGAIDGSELWLLPCFTDLRARFGEPGYEYRETIQSGLAAAAAGGYGAVCVLPDCDPPADEGVVVQAMRKAAELAGTSELLPVGALTKGLAGRELAEFGALKGAGVVALSDADHFVGSAALMRRIFEYALSFDLLVMQQPTDPSLGDGSVMHEGAVSARLGLRGCPSVAEQVALERDLALVRHTGARYHASALSTKEAVIAIARAKDEGLPVTADVAVANLVWTHQSLAHYEASFRVVPPLRDESDRKALLEGLEQGVIDAVSSNHAPCSTLEKSGEIDLSSSGMISLELCLPALLELERSGAITRRTLVRCLASAPSAILRRPGASLREGELASFTLIDPNRTFVPKRDGLLSLSRNTPLWDREQIGKVLLTVHRGGLLYRDPSLPPTAPS